MDKDIKVLVVGGAGYIGGGVTDILKARNIPFTVYDSLLFEQHYLKPVDFIKGDIRETEKLKELLKDYTHVIWLAAMVGDAACQVKPELTVAVNQVAPQWLAENFDGKIIFMSTCSVYGRNEGELDENSPLNPLSLYAETKIAAEKALLGKDALIFRLGTVFGMSDAFSRLRMDLVVNYMTANAVTKGKLSVFGGTQWRPLIHVLNVAEAVVNGIENHTAGIYNLATMNCQIKDLGYEVSKVTGCEVELASKEFEDLRNYHVSTEKAKKAGMLEFPKVYTLEDGIRQIYDVVKSGRLRYVENDIYSNERHVANLVKNGELI